MAKKPIRTIPIALFLDDDQAAAVQNVGALQDVASNVVRQLADGGMMLSARTVSDITDIIGEFDPDILVASVQSAANRKEGQYSGEWRVDPAWVSGLKDRAESRGQTMQQLVQDMMDYALGNGWLESMDNPPHMVFLSAEDLQYIKQSLGVESVTGTDLVELLRAQMGVKESVFE